MLVDAGFKALSRFAVLLNKCRLTNPLASKGIILPHRRVGRLSKIAGTAPLLRFNMTVTTGHKNPERAAAVLEVRFYSLLGTELPVAQGSASHDLFADPVGSAEPQPAYFYPPKGAVWVVAWLERRTNSRRIGATGSLVPETVKSLPQVSIEAVLHSRDRQLLEDQLQQASERADRTRAISILARMIFLEQRRPDRALQRQIRDIDYVLGQLPARGQAQNTEGHTFQYQSLLSGSYTPSMQFSRWLDSETAGLKAVCTGDVVVTQGADAALRLVAALYAGFSVRLADDVVLEPPSPWISGKDLAEIRTLTCDGGDI